MQIEVGQQQQRNRYSELHIIDSFSFECCEDPKMTHEDCAQRPVSTACALLCEKKTRYQLACTSFPVRSRAKLLIGFILPSTAIAYGWDMEFRMPLRLVRRDIGLVGTRLVLGKPSTEDI
nr:hypothetical protein CFP56_30897 [Quercus suber]